MLKLLNLYVLSRIFAEAKQRPTTMSEAFYISCLMRFFSDKEATSKNAYAFEMKPSELPYHPHIPELLRELGECELVVFNGCADSVHFPNKWGQLIDRSLLDKNVEYKSGYTPSPISHFKEQLLTRDTLHENCRIQYRISKAQIAELINLFVIQQTDEETKYLTITEASRHCGYWIGKNLHKLKTLDKTVKSGAKRLG